MIYATIAKAQADGEKHKINDVKQFTFKSNRSVINCAELCKNCQHTFAKNWVCGDDVLLKSQQESR